MFGFFNKKTTKLTPNPSTSLEDDSDYVEIAAEDDEWEEIKSYPTKKTPTTTALPIIVPITTPVTTIASITQKPSQVQREIPAQPEDRQVQVINNVQVPVPVQEPEPEPAWKLELAKRDKTPYVVANASSESYTKSDNGLPYVQSGNSQQSYVASQNQGEPYSITSVSTVNYVTAYVVPVKDTVQNDAPYCVAY